MAQPEFHNYSPDRVLLIANGVDIKGFADGTFVKWARAAKNFTVKAGAGGDVVRTRTLNRIGTITVTLLAACSANDLLQGFVDTDEETGLGTFAVTLQELGGSTIVDGGIAWVESPADGEYADEAGSREWTIVVAQMNVKNGGSVI